VTWIWAWVKRSKVKVRVKVNSNTALQRGFINSMSAFWFELQIELLIASLMTIMDKVNKKLTRDEIAKRDFPVYLFILQLYINSCIIKISNEILAAICHIRLFGTFWPPLGTPYPWDNRGKCYMDGKRIQCWSNA